MYLDLKIYDNNNQVHKYFKLYPYMYIKWIWKEHHVWSEQNIFIEF